MNLKTYINQQRGRAAAIGRALGVVHVLISQWASGVRPIPAERCPAIERATGGAVTCEELRPDVDWQFIRANPHSATEPREKIINPVVPTVGAANPETVHE